jgi:hypothetical protein
MVLIVFLQFFYIATEIILNGKKNFLEVGSAMFVTYTMFELVVSLTLFIGVLL